MHNRQRTIVCFLVLVLMAAGTVSAARKGRLVGRVLDSEGHPIEGVTVIATSEELPNFREIETTDKKGVFKIDFDEINVEYRYRFEKAGYLTLETEQTWQKDGTARYDFTMYPGEATTVEGLPPASESSEAILAFNRGVKAIDAKDFAAALAAFEEAVVKDPDLRQGWVALCVVQLRLAHYQEAAEAAEKAMALGATDEALLRSRFEAYRNLGDEAKAAEALDDLERAGQRAEEAKGIFNEAVRLSKSGDLEGALAKYQEAVEMDPNLQIAQLGVATTALKVGHNEVAVAAAEAILDQDPRNEDAIRIRYNAALASGNEDLILDSLVSLAPIEPEIAHQGLWTLATAAYDANDMERAKRRLIKVLQVNPNHPRAHYFLGLVYVGEGANEKAQGHLERFLEIAPDDTEAGTAADLLEFLRGS